MSQSADLRPVDLRGGRQGAGTATRVPPHNLNAEESLLGAMLLSRDAIGPAAEICGADDFYKPAHGHIFEAITSLWTRGEPADAVTVADELNRADLLEAIGGVSALVSMQANTPATSNAQRYATIIEEHSLLRGLIRVAGEIAELGYDVPEDVTEALDKAESAVFKIAEKRVADTTKPLRELLSETLDSLEALYEKGDEITGVPTGFLDLDQQLSGLQPNALIIIGARPAMGKCVAWDTPIPDPTTGELRTAAEVYRLGMEGEVVDVLSLDEDRTLKTTQPSAFVDDGIKPLFSVRTASGRHIRTTLTHPFLTPEGWRPLGKLKVGSQVGVPKRLPVFGIDPLPESELALMAYLLTSGGRTDEQPAFVSNVEEAVVEAARHAGSLGGRALCRNSDDQLSVHFVGQPGYANPIGELLRRYGMLTCPTQNREIPAPVYRLPEKQLAFFLQRFLTVDAQVVTGISSPSELRFGFASQKMAHNAQHLLLRFGVSTNLRAVDGGAVLVVDEATQLRIFAHEIGLVGRTEELQRLQAQMSATPAKQHALVGAAHGGGGAHRGDVVEPADDVFAPTLWESAAAFLNEQPDVVTLPTNADIRWDPIVSIDYDGDEQVYDLTIPIQHNFVAGDFVVHNTSFALNIVANAAMNNYPVLFFSLEMGHSEITQRLLCSEARVDASRLRNGRLHDSDWPKINQAIGRLGEAPIYIDDNPACTVMDIRAKARRLKASEGGLGLVVVDYMQLMSGRGNAESRQQEVSEMSRGLKILARELEVPVIALSQLSRNLEQRADKRPVLADLRESGSLEQDADVVMFLYRDEVYNPESPEKGVAEVIVSKHRAGPVGTTQLAFIDRYTRFANMAKA